MARMTPEEIYRVALQAGFDPERAVTFTAIALAESRGDPQANAAGSEDSRGLWQINVSPGVRDNVWGDLYDPLVNARAAFDISDGGTRIQPWSVTHPRHAGTAQDYRTHLDEARAAAAAVGTAPAAAGGDAAGVEVFVQSALAQVGDSYVFGVDAALDDPDPDAFDCSELVEWAARRAGVTVPDGTWLQYLELDEQGALTTVEEAIDTRGALLFSFSQTPTPGGGRPSQAHVAISLGDGRVVEAANPGDGVVVSPADPDRFTHAAVVPGLATAVPTSTVPAAPPDDGGAAHTTAAAAVALPEPTDRDGDGLTDEFEALLGTAPDALDTDGDALDDATETSRTHTDPRAADTDADGVADGVEVAGGADPGRYRLPDAAVAAGFGGAQTADVDRDGVSDLDEFRLGSDRDAADSDADGVGDDFEHALRSDLTGIDTDRDGLTDGVEFDLGSLGPAPVPTGAADPVAGDPPGAGDVLPDGLDVL